MTRVGLLGAGAVGALHAAAYRQLDNAELRVIADVDQSAADRLAREHGVRACYGIEPLLGDDEIEMVDVCLPTFLHERAVVAAAGAGKHVLCEKPVALSLQEVDSMMAAVDRAGVKAMVAQVIRFWPQYATIKELLEQGELGSPLVSSAARLSVPRKPAWFRDPQLGGGALLDLLIHDLDYLFYLYGSPASVFSTGLASPAGAWDHVLTTLNYGSHKAAVESSYLMPEGFPFLQSFRLLGTEGCVEFRSQGEIIERAAEPAGFVVHLAGQPPVHPSCPRRDAYMAEIEYFVRCLLEDQPPQMASLSQARTVLQIALAVKESLETGQVVFL